MRRLWRSRHRLQLGLDPARAVVLELADPDAAGVLDLLDGTRSERAVIAQATRHGVAEGDARALLDSLRRAGLIIGAHALLPTNLPAPLRQRLSSEAAALAMRGTEAPAAPAQLLRRRAAAKVALVGGGPLARPVGLALAQSGVGHVALAMPAAPEPDPHVSAEERAFAGAVAEQAPGTRTDALDRRHATFAVHLGSGTPAVVAAAGYARRGLTHLTVLLREGTAVIGPLVPPRGLPCLNCLDLHRRDRDPEWPSLAAQLARAPMAGPCAAATVLTAAGIAATEVLGWIDGRTPTTLGASVEVTPDGELRRRSWPPHAACHCVRNANRRTRPPAPPGVPPADRR